MTVGFNIFSSDVMIVVSPRFNFYSIFRKKIRFDLDSFAPILGVEDIKYDVFGFAGV